MKKEEWLKKGYVDEPVEKRLTWKRRSKDCVVKRCRNPRPLLPGRRNTGNSRLHWRQSGTGSVGCQNGCKDHCDVRGTLYGWNRQDTLSGQKVLIPDLNAGCSLADSCPADKFAAFVKDHPGYKVISYVNTSAAVKAVTDVVVTSTNARQIVESFPEDENWFSVLIRTWEIISTLSPDVRCCYGTVLAMCTRNSLWKRLSSWKAVSRCTGIGSSGMQGRRG